MFWRSRKKHFKIPTEEDRNDYKEWAFPTFGFYLLWNVILQGQSSVYSITWFRKFSTGIFLFFLSLPPPHQSKLFIYLCAYMCVLIYLFSLRLHLFSCVFMHGFIICHQLLKKNNNNNKTDSLIHDFTGTWRINVPSSSYVFTCNLFVVLKNFQPDQQFHWYCTHYYWPKIQPCLTKLFVI